MHRLIDFYRVFDKLLLKSVSVEQANVYVFINEIFQIASLSVTNFLTRR